MGNFYASRNAGPDIWRDEDRAMAHDSWGPFSEAETARRRLCSAMREEADFLDSNGHTERAEEIRVAALRVETEHLNRIEVVGLVWAVDAYAW